MEVQYVLDGPNVEARDMLSDERIGVEPRGLVAIFRWTDFLRRPVFYYNSIVRS